MTPNLYGRPFRSQPEVYDLSKPITFKPDYMQGARHMDAPGVWAIDMLFTGTVGAVTGGALGRDAAKLFDKVVFNDADGILNCSGQGMRVVEQVDRGYKQRDPADITSGSTNTTYEYRLRWTIEPKRAVRERDYTLPILSFLDGGEFTIQCAAALPTGWAAIQTDWKVQLVAWIRDKRRKEAPSRRRIKEEAMTQQEFDYQINGFLRGAYGSSKLTTTGASSWAPYTTLNSRTMEWPSTFKTTNLVEDYRAGAIEMLGTNDEFTLATPGALPFVAPRYEQMTGRMVDTKSLHIDLLQAPPTNARLITDVLIDRDADQTTALFGYNSLAQTDAALKAGGKIVVADGDNPPVVGQNTQLARKLPVRPPSK